PSRSTRTARTSLVWPLKVRGSWELATENSPVASSRSNGFMSLSFGKPADDLQGPCRHCQSWKQRIAKPGFNINPRRRQCSLDCLELPPALFVKHDTNGRGFHESLRLLDFNALQLRQGLANLGALRFRQVHSRG